MQQYLLPSAPSMSWTRRFGPSLLSSTEGFCRTLQAEEAMFCVGTRARFAFGIAALKIAMPWVSGLFSLVTSCIANSHPGIYITATISTCPPGGILCLTRKHPSISQSFPPSLLFDQASTETHPTTKTHRTTKKRSPLDLFC